MPTLNRLLSDNFPIDPTKNTFTGNGSQTVFNLSGQVLLGVNNPSNLIVTLDGATQEPNVDYSINNAQVTFTTAPDSGAKVVVVYRNAPYIIGSTIVSDGSVTTAKIAGGNITPDKLSTGAPFWNSSSNVALGHSSPATNLHLNYANYGAILFGNNNANGFHITKESSDNTFNIWSGAIGSGTNRIRIMPSGNIGFGGIDASARVHLRGNNTGTTEGNNSAGLWLETNNGNLSILEIEDYRVTNGNGWQTAGYRIQQRTDATSQAFIQFNGNNNHGISFGAGGSNISPHSVPTRLAIYENGLIDAYDNPIIGSPTTAKAHIVFGGNYIQSVYSNAPANTYIEAFAGNKLGYWWGFSAGWAWARIHEGLTYWMRLGGVAQTVAGIAPDGSIGVPIKLKRFISANQMEFEWVTGTPNTGGQVLIGNGATSGYTYITNGVKESFNVSLLVKNAIGDYTIYFTNPMQNRDYVFCGASTMLGNQTNWISGRHNLGVIESSKGNSYLRFAVSYQNTILGTVEDDVTLVVFSNA